MLPLTQAEKEMMLGKIPNMPDFYPQRAKLGDTVAEKKLITAFESTGDYHVKCKYAWMLGHAGTPECAKALVRSLNSPIIKKSPKYQYCRSVRVPIIKALGRIHPEVSFLRMDISYIDMWGDGYYGGAQRVKEYLDRVSKWAEQAYHVKPVDKEPDAVLKSFPQDGFPFPEEY